jgi:predicted MFS family arabinose efflux permease
VSRPVYLTIIKLGCSERKAAVSNSGFGKPNVHHFFAFIFGIGHLQSLKDVTSIRAGSLTMSSLHGSRETAPSLPPSLTPPPAEQEQAVALAAGPPESGVGLRGTFRSLRHRNYRLYFIGQLISLTGSWVQTTALNWLAFELTRRSMGPALVMVAQALPTVLLGAWGGTLADRLPKRTLLIITQSALLILALVLAGLVFAGSRAFWAVLLVTLASGIVQAVDLPARLAFVMEMVGREDLMNAVALNSLLFNVARAVGPAFAGWMLIGLGPELCFLVNGLSFVAVIWALVLMEAAGRGSPIAAKRRSGIAEGLRYLAERPGLAVLILLSGLLSLCGWPFQALLPALAEHVLDSGAQGYSWMLSGTGFGALAAALTVATFGSLARRRQFIGAGVAILTGALFGLSLVRSPLLAVVCCALIGYGLILFFATSQSVVQLSAEEHNRGLIMGIWAMLLSVALPLGSLIAGEATNHLGEPTVLLVQGLACGSATAASFLLLRRWKLSKSPSS